MIRKRLRNINLALSIHFIYEKVLTSGWRTVKNAFVYAPYCWDWAMLEYWGSSVDQEPTVDWLPSALPSGIPNKKWHYESSWPILFSSKLIWKETLFPPKFDSRMVNADWLITRQVKQTLDYVNYGAVDGLLNECIRRYFYSPRAKEAEEVTSLVNIPIRSINRV